MKKLIIATTMGIMLCFASGAIAADSDTSTEPTTKVETKGQAKANKAMHKKSVGKAESQKHVKTKKNAKVKKNATESQE